MPVKVSNDARPSDTLAMLPRRRSVRIEGHDYASGAYFVTICTADRKAMFGTVRNGQMLLNRYGHGAADTLAWLVQTFRQVTVHESIVMPNHLHLVLQLDPSSPKPKPLGSVVGAFKTAATRRINAMRGIPQVEVWQRNLYEKILEDESEIYAACEYVRCNPEQWTEDHLCCDAEARLYMERGRARSNTPLVCMDSPSQSFGRGSWRAAGRASLGSFETAW